MKDMIATDEEAPRSIPFDRNTSLIKLMPAIQPLLWLLRTGLWLLFPLCIVAEYILGGLLLGGTDTLMHSFMLGYIIALCTILAVITGIYRGTTFEVTQRSVFSERDFIIKERKELLFSNVKEIELKVSVLQRLFGVGTVILHTQASFVGKSKTGLALFDLENSSEIYTVLKEKISDANLP